MTGAFFNAILFVCTHDFCQSVKHFFPKKGILQIKNERSKKSEGN